MALRSGLPLLPGTCPPLLGAGRGIPVSRHYSVAPEHAVSHAAQLSLLHPRQLAYPAPAAARAVAVLLKHPTWVADSFSAACLLGVPEFSEGADVFVLGKGNRRLASHPLTPTIHRLPAGLTAWTLWYHDHPLRCLPPAMALVRCLRILSDGLHTWPVPAMAHLSASTVRAVQLIDQFRRRTEVTEAEIVAAARSRFDARLLHKYLALSSSLADSVPETSLRLMLTPQARDLGVHLVPQVPVRSGERLVTVLDLADPQARVGVMYDGAHHWTRDQRNRDARINAELKAMGWEVIRFSQAALANAPETHLLFERFVRAARR
ncbi:endonuclease domain-containing protein [Corynebacterium tapiri]|uniref:DUF559 domain-containing protein n=1 Tax=Corynebacterium tapiri TaxID=1448266 RepID=A0A5C4U4A2_9CORY|nr:DUF559 domain-containing protein [Corynebacterium tapiri]TNL97410.1 DUF559 domain-containing protein [Corynebacterium tapiri]